MNFWSFFEFDRFVSDIKGRRRKETKNVFRRRTQCWGRGFTIRFFFSLWNSWHAKMEGCTSRIKIHRQQSIHTILVLTRGNRTCNAQNSFALSNHTPQFFYLFFSLKLWMRYPVAPLSHGNSATTFFSVALFLFFFPFSSLFLFLFLLLFSCLFLFCSCWSCGCPTRLFHSPIAINWFLKCKNLLSTHRSELTFTVKNYTSTCHSARSKWKNVLPK